MKIGTMRRSTRIYPGDGISANSALHPKDRPKTTLLNGAQCNIFG